MELAWLTPDVARRYAADPRIKAPLSDMLAEMAEDGEDPEPLVEWHMWVRQVTRTGWPLIAAAHDDGIDVGEQAAARVADLRRRGLLK